MSDSGEIRTISFDRPDDILAAIRNRETFEVGGCHGRMPEAVLFVERAIGGEGMSSRTFTKGRKAALAGMLVPSGATQLVGLVAAAGMAAQNVATLNPDYEIMKRPVDKALRLSYVKDAPSVAERTSNTASAVGRGIAAAAAKTASLAKGVASTVGENVSAAAGKTASFASEAKSAVGQGVTAVAEKTASLASNAASSTAAAWNEHAPSKETVVGTLVLGGLAPLVIGKDGVEAAGAKTIAKVSDVAGAIGDKASDAVGVVGETFKHASPWALVGGAIVGVGAVAAAPFTGGGSVLGGATLIASLSGAAGTAVAVGGVGAAAGAAVSSASKKQAIGEGYRQGKEGDLAEAAAKIQVLQERLVLASERYREQNKLNEFIVCLIAVGAGMAACDGVLHEDDMSNLQEFVLGMSVFALPPAVENAIQQLLAKPPTFDEAMLYADRLGSDIWPVIDAILLNVSETQGEATEQGKVFLTKWADYKDAHRQGEMV
ncbi:hypothetical protein [Magnetospirillum sp. SS-4]|uniref:hypothetical protein n=1 Tax=Magnetospirillum sp. SS-4 TaxID=2681465 RepID=UPI00137FD962|nr:hypothetical protein [Magnetospirillum sp. SS-4]CAA7627267.1 conserved membrane hypothetical protein [Magnetospirillum sp. SS-4]